MKKISGLVILLLACSTGEAQLLKKLGDKVKEEVEYRVRRKAGQKIDVGIDKVFELPKKIRINKKGNEPQAEDGDKQVVSNKKGKGNSHLPITTGDNDGEELTAKDGFVTLELSSSSIFTGSAIRFTGESIRYKQYGSVEISINGPSVNELRTATLGSNGEFVLDWTATEATGDFTVTVKSSDKKSKRTATFTVQGIDWMDNWGDESIEETRKAYDNLEVQVSGAKEKISPKDRAELEKKLGEVKKKVDGLVKLFSDLNTAGKATASLARKSKRIPPSFKRELSDLGTTLSTHARQMAEINKKAQHTPSDVTICEYLVMVNEACAAFSAVSNVATLNIWGIVKNIALDKGVPKAAGEINEAAGGIKAPYDFPLKEASKIFATSKTDAESLVSTMGKAGIAGDLVQFASDVLMKLYCGTFSGEMIHDYTINFKNNNGETWWKYGVKMKGNVSLRYPKEGAEKGIIKMKGCIEGNATSFSFYQNVAVEESFKMGTKEKIEVVELKVIKPPAVPFVSSQADKFGFGAAARTLATPASFYILIDAEYDPDNKTIKLYINKAVLDFSTLIKNTFIFLLIGPDLLPYIKRMDFPIHPARLTINGSLKENNEFPVSRDKSSNLSFIAKQNRHIGKAPDVIETDLNLLITAKKD